MKIILLALSVLVYSALADTKPVPSGPLKVFKGPEGEVVGMVEVNEGKQVLVHFNNIGGEIEGQSRLYSLDNEGYGRKTATWKKKQGSKMLTLHLMDYKDGEWMFHNPGKPGNNFSLRYSEEATGKMKLEDVISAYKP